MDKNAIVGTLDRFRLALEARGVRIGKIILYGSWAVGTGREGSDIDVVVISPDFAGKGFWERIDLLADAVYEVFAPIEAVAMTPEEWDRGESFIVDYARNGEVFFAA